MLACPTGGTSADAVVDDKSPSIQRKNRQLQRDRDANKRLGSASGHIRFVIGIGSALG
jgi:hypothetical protein